MSSDFHFFVPENLVQIGKAVSEKIRFEFLYVHYLGPKSRNDLDLQYSHTFKYSTRFLKDFYHLGRGDHLGHVTSIMSSDY